MPPTTTRKLRISPTPNVDGLYSHDDVFCVGDQAATADCVPSTSAEAHQAHAHPGYDDARYITPCGKGVKRWGLRRLLLCGRLNEAMATWDHAAVERWKGKLGLEMVKPPLYADDAMKPSLLVYQGLGTGI